MDNRQRKADEPVRPKSTWLIWIALAALGFLWHRTFTLVAGYFRGAAMALFLMLESGMLAAGERVAEFERKFADYCGTMHAVAINNGTAAIHAALLAADIGPGDEVIVPSFTFVSTVNAFVARGARPVFVDIRPDTLNLDENGRARGSLEQHLLGVHDGNVEIDGTAPDGVRFVLGEREAKRARR